jgi:4-hydroxybutyrate CoA-transferase
MSVFVQGLASDPAFLRRAWSEKPNLASRLHFAGALPPGISDIDYAALGPDTHFDGLFLGRVHQNSMSEGRAHLLPLGYRAAYDWFERRAFDIAIIQVSPPDDQGRCSLSLTADFAEAAISGASYVLAYVNSALPRTHGAFVDWNDIDGAVHIDEPVPHFPASVGTDDATSRIARNVASIIRDGDCLQLGIGSVPSAVLKELHSHKNLGYHGGLITDDLLDLFDAGILNGQRKSVDNGRVVTGAAIGTARLYDRVTDDQFLFRNSKYTHCSTTLARLDNFVSINSAIEVDLFGQVNSETIGHQQVSGCGGALDFVRGANLSRGGRAIIAMPSTTAAGKSKIVPRLAPSTPVTISRSDAVIVVTEHGVADLRNLNNSERELALISIASPEYQPDLLGSRL